MVEKLDLISSVCDWSYSSSLWQSYLGLNYCRKIVRTWSWNLLLSIKSKPAPIPEFPATEKEAGWGREAADDWSPKSPPTKKAQFKLINPILSPSGANGFGLVWEKIRLWGCKHKDPNMEGWSRALIKYLGAGWWSQDPGVEAKSMRNSHDPRHKHLKVTYVQTICLQHYMCARPKGTAHAY